MATTYKFIKPGGYFTTEVVGKIVDGKTVTIMPRANDTWEWVDYQEWLKAGNTTEAAD